MGPVKNSATAACAPVKGVFAQDVGVQLVDWLEERTHLDLRGSGVLGWAWATVDLERALAEAGDHATRRWSPVEDELLGARGLRLLDAEPAVVLLEPSTEGRLAGWLARNGEGEAAVYVLPEQHAAQSLQSPRMTAIGLAGWIANAAERTPIGMPVEIRVARVPTRHVPFRACS